LDDSCHVVFERLNLGCHERVSGPRRGWGPEDEPSSILRDIYRSQRRYRRGKPHPIYDALRVIRCPTLSVSLNGDEEARTFAGLLGGPTRQTLVASQYEAVRSSEEGCTLVPAIQNDMRAWLDDVCRASQPEPSLQGSVSGLSGRLFCS